MIKISVYTLGFPGYRLEDVIRISAEIGYDGIDIRVREDGHIYIDASKEYRKKILELTNSYDLDIYGIYSYLGERFVSRDQNIREKALEDIKKHLDLTVDLEGIYLRIFPGTSEISDENMRLFTEMLKQACKEAEDRDIYIGIETHGELVVNGDTCNYVLNEVGSEKLKIVFDPANVYLREYNPVKELIKVKLDDVIAVQFHDIKKEGNTRKSVLLGEGDVPFDPIFDYLVEKTYQGYIVDEYEKWWHPELPDPKEGLPIELRYLKEKLKLLI
ncbi:MAG: sugar phosphate isomerase/epimerase [Thermoproteales archaeon]|nr:sugar phosphate isomerase/epimerase [Thermoproteales archaeon]